jgi:hypothetical protein
MGQGDYNFSPCPYSAKGRQGVDGVAMGWKEWKVKVSRLLYCFFEVGGFKKQIVGDATL